MFSISYWQEKNTNNFSSPAQVYKNVNTALALFSNKRESKNNDHWTFLGVRKLEKPEWTPMMEQALNVIYFLAEHPEKIAGIIIKKIAACLLDKATQDKVDTEAGNGSQDNKNGKNV